MSEFWNKMKSWLKASEDSSPSQPFLHELISRTEEELASYEKWKNELQKRRLIDWINAEYVISRSNPEAVDEGLDFLDTPVSKGFVIHFQNTKFEQADLLYFFDYLKESVLVLGYQSYVSDHRTYNRDSKVESVQRHYLKPPMNFEAGKKSDQRFGNIRIELLSVNDRLVNLKFSATGYKDHKYHEMEDFKSLMEELFL